MKKSKNSSSTFMQCMSGTFRNCCTDNGRFSEGCDTGS